MREVLVCYTVQVFNIFWVNSLLALTNTGRVNRFDVFVKISRYICKFYATKTRNVTLRTSMRNRMNLPIPYMFILDFTVNVQYATLRTLMRNRCFIIETTRNNE